MPMTGTELRRLRTRLKLTQKQLAGEIGVTENTVARWERDEVKISEPAVKLLQTIRRAKNEP
jgi:DNA-binding transcriptional regulator YiaG